MKQEIGEDGISMSETDGATQYSNYQVYLDLLEMGYTEERALQSMKMTKQQLNKLKETFGENAD